MLAIVIPTRITAVVHHHGHKVILFVVVIHVHTSSLPCHSGFVFHVVIRNRCLVILFVFVVVGQCLEAPIFLQGHSPTGNGSRPHVFGIVPCVAEGFRDGQGEFLFLAAAFTMFVSVMMTVVGIVVMIATTSTTSRMTTTISTTSTARRIVSQESFPRMPVRPSHTPNDLCSEGYGFEPIAVRPNGMRQRRFRDRSFDEGSYPFQNGSGQKLDPSFLLFVQG